MGCARGNDRCSAHECKPSSSRHWSVQGVPARFGCRNQCPLTPTLSRKGRGRIDVRREGMAQAVGGWRFGPLSPAGLADLAGHGAFVQEAAAAPARARIDGDCLRRKDPLPASIGSVSVCPSRPPGPRLTPACAGFARKWQGYSRRWPGCRLRHQRQGEERALPHSVRPAAFAQHPCCQKRV